MSECVNVLVTGCSKHSKDLVDCLKQNDDGVTYTVTAVNMDENKLLRHGTDAQYVVPPITHPGYIDILLNICHENEIDLIIPYITAELELLAEAKPYFEANGVKVSVASPEAIRILNDKKCMYERFGYLMPKQTHVMTGLQAFAALQISGYPAKKVCCKISGRCGGTGFCILDEEKCYDISQFNRCGIDRYMGMEELFHIMERGDNEVILQEYVSGVDYSVCVLADNGEVLYAVGYAGYDMEFGAVVNGEIVTNKKAIEIASGIVSDTGYDGIACFDFILPGKDLVNSDAVLLECNPRISASNGFCWQAGVNMLHLRCMQLMGHDVRNVKCEVKEGLRMQKYYESEYYV